MQLLFASLAAALTVASASAESPPVLPQTCAIAYDDPHLTSFDGYNYDCQGNGDFVLSKSLTSDFELQGRFYKEDWPSGLVGTTTEATVLKTGTAGEPKVEASYDRQCNLKYYINDVLMDTLEVDLDTKDDKVSFYKSGKDRYFVFADSGVSLRLTLRLNHVFGCFLNVKLCIPDSLKTENIVGLFGSPDGDYTNDYMDRQGTAKNPGVDQLWWGQVYDYCTQTWCIGANDDSLFHTPGDTSLCQQPYDDKCEKEVEQAPEEIKEKCGNNTACIIDSIVAGDDGETGTETKNDERELNEKEEIEDCDESLQMVAALCALPDGADQYSVVTQEDAHIGAHSMYKGLAVGGVLYDASPDRSGTIDTTMSYLKALDTNNRFNFNAQKEVGSSCMADSMTARLEYLAMNAKNYTSDNGEYIVVVTSRSGTFDLDAFRDGGDSDDNGHTLAIFSTHEDIYITDEGGRQFGPTIIAPFATVYVQAGTGYVDGSIYAKALYAENGSLQLHGKTYHGPIECGNGEAEQRVTHTCGALGSETAFSRPTDNDNVGCFLQDGHNRWGWTMEIPASHSGSYTYDVFAAAGQCDTSKGDLVGEVTVIYDAVAKTCEGQYMATGGHSIEEFQFYCGTDPYPKKNNGQDTVAPGSYSCVHSDTETPTSDTCIVDNVEPDSNSKIHAIAHAVSCNASDETLAPTSAPTSAPTGAPTGGSGNGSCKLAWEQCGGNGYSGSTCCEAGYLCERDSEWWSACKPAPPSGSCKLAWEQCGGNGYTGETCCQAGYSCQADSEWWSACKPGSNPTPTTSAPTGSPTESPTEAPETPAPTSAPTETPETGAPTASPTETPETGAPTASPTETPETGAPTASPTETPETSAPTASPTDTPETSSPTASPTGAPTAPEGCPEEMPEFGGACNFQGKCPYGRETCCGQEHDSVIMQCFDGTAQGFHTDACLNAKCDDEEPEPEPPVCATDVKECDDGTVVGRTGPGCEFICPKTSTPPGPNKGSGSGDPHFKTWTGDKYDYHGECDLVLVSNPSFADGLGLRVHIRTTRVKYFSFIEKVAVQLGNDILEFDNDVENFLINGKKVEANHKHHKTRLAGYVVRRDKKAISIRLHDEGRHSHNNAKIDLHTRKNGFPAVIVDGARTDIFRGSLGLLGDWETGKRIARDGKTEMNDEDATAFALEWQVRDTEPMLFTEARFPQFPTICNPPAKMVGGRLGNTHFQKEAEEACAHWEEDKEDCIFDVIATRDVLVAAEGHIVHVK